MAGNPKPIGTLDCRCGRPAALFKSQTAKNPDRWFFKCDECNFFKFADTVQGYPMMPSASQTPQHQLAMWTPTHQQAQQHQSSTPGRLPLYSEPPVGSAERTGGARDGGSQQKATYMEPQNPPQYAVAAWQQQPQVQQQTWQQHPPCPSPPQQHTWLSGAPSDQQQQCAPLHHSQSQLGQQVVQQQTPYQGYGSQGSGAQGGTQNFRGAEYGWQGSQQQQPQSQWLQQPNQQQGWQPMSPQGRQLSAQQGPDWQQHQHQQSPIQQQQWVRQQQWNQQPRHYPSDGPAGHSQQQQSYASPVRAPSSGAAASSPAAAAAASPGQGIVVKVYPAPVELNMPHHLALKLSGYHPCFVSVIKDLPFSSTDRHWHKEGKVWLVLTRAWDEVKAHLEAQGFTVTAVHQATAEAAGGGVLDMCALESSDARLVPLLTCEEAERQVSSVIPAATWDALMQHQQAGVLAGLRRRGRLLLADEMGLGKTAQFSASKGGAIVLACCYPQHWPLLVVLPASLRGVWRAELQAWITPELQPPGDHLHVLRSGEELRRLLEAGLPSDPHQVLVLTYDLVKKLPAQTAARFGVVICDESHHLKNKDAQRTQAVSTLVRGAAVAVLITGTPLLSRPIEIWSQIDMLRPGLLGSYDEFGTKYCVPGGQPSAGSSGSGWGNFPGPQYHGCNRSRIDELHRLLLANVMVRRTKEQVGLALPAKTRMKVCVPLDPAMQPQLLSIRSAMQLMADRNETDTPEAKRLINEYRIASGRAKVPGVLEFIQGLPGIKPEDNCSDNDEEQRPGQKRPAAAGTSAAGRTGKDLGKVLVFAYHQEVLNMLQSELGGKQALGCIRIDGSTASEARHQLVARFQSDPSVRVGLLSIKAAGAGLTLTAADRVVFAELHWNPSDLNQAEDRIHRMGQAQHCTIYYCMAAECADDLMWGTIVRKLRIVGAAVDGQEASSSQGLGQLQTWSQQVQGSQGDVGLGGHDAPGVGSGAGRSPGDSHHKLQQQNTGGGENRANSGAAAVSADGTGTGDSSRRRCLLGEFNTQAGEGHRAPQLAGSPAAGAGAAAKPGAAVTPTTDVAYSKGTCESIDLTGDDDGDNQSSAADARAEASMPEHLTGTTLPLTYAAEDHDQGASQAGDGAATQGSLSSVAVGDLPDDGHTHVTAKRRRQE